MKKMNKEKFPSQFDGPSKSPGFLLWQTTNLWQKKQREALAPFGLTHVQFVLLAGVYYLTMEGQKLTQNHLALHACMDRMMTSQVVRKLEQKKWVKRISDAEDARANILSITPEGKALIKKTMPVIEDVDHNFFLNLKEKKKDLTELLAVLSK